MRNRKIWWRGMIALAAGLCAASPVTAQDAGGPAASPASETSPAAPRSALDEIIVSASRRDESLQDVPVAVTAFSAETIGARELASVSDLQMQTPGLNYAHVVGAGQITMRGVGSDLYTINAEPGVAMYLNDIYLSRTFLSQASMLGLERVEVLRGPQGTLYGRNTSGGAIKFVTKRPSNEFEAKASAQIGAYEQRVAELNASGPIIADVLRVRAGAYWENHEGWTTNLVDGEKLSGQNILSLATTLDFDPLSWLGFTLDADFQREHNESPLLQATTPLLASAIGNSAALPLLAPFDTLIGNIEGATGVLLDPLRMVLSNQIGGRQTLEPREVYADTRSGTWLKTRGIAATANAELRFATLKLIGGWRKHDQRQIYDSDGSDLALVTFEPYIGQSRQLSLEAQLQSPAENRLRWIAGLYVFDDDALESIDIDLLKLDVDTLDQLGAVLPPNLPFLQGGALAQIDVLTLYDSRSYAAFADASYELFDWLTLRAGGRYTHDEKHANITYYAADVVNNCANVDVEESWAAFTGKLGADIRVNEDLLVYGSFSQGFKSGGFNSTNCGSEPYDPERVNAYEAGVKSEWWGKRLRVNLAAFYYSFTDIQVQQIDLLLTFITNAAEASIKGAELEVTVAPLEWLTLDGSLSLLDATYDNFIDDEALTLLEGDVDLSGNRLPKSPRATSSVGLTLHHEIAYGYQGMLRGEWIYRGLQYFTQFNNANNSQSAFHLFNAYLTLTHPAGGAALQLFVKNIANKDYLEGGAVASALVGGPVVFYAPPRRWGVELSYAF